MMVAELETNLKQSVGKMIDLESKLNTSEKRLNTSKTEHKEMRERNLVNAIKLENELKAAKADIVKFDKVVQDLRKEAIETCEPPQTSETTKHDDGMFQHNFIMAGLGACVGAVAVATPIVLARFE